MKKQLLFLFVFMASISQINASVKQYAFQAASGTYTPITGGTVVATATGLSGNASLDDMNFTLPNGTIPFTFYFNYIGYTGLNINTNGYITFGATLPVAGLSTPISSTTGFAGCIAAAARDLNALYNIEGHTGEIRYQTVGTAPNREFVIQFKNFRPFSNSSSTTSYWRWNFQIRLSETHNISIVYDFHYVGSPESGTVQVGLRGASNNDNRNLWIDAAWTSISWANPVIAFSNTSTCAYNTGLIPASGQTYNFNFPRFPEITASPVSYNQIDLDILPNFFDDNVLIAWNTSYNFGPLSGSYSPGDQIEGGGTVLYVGEAPVTINHTGLETGLVYFYAAVSILPDGSYAGGRLIWMPTVYDLPFEDDFEDWSGFAVLEPGWSYETANFQWWSDFGTNNSMGLGVNLYSGRQVGDVITPVMMQNSDDLRLVFDYRIVDYEDYPNIPITLGVNDKIEIFIHTTDGADPVLLHTINQSNHISSVNFLTKFLPINGYSGINFKIQWKASWGAGDYYVAIDNVMIEVTPSCDYPYNLTATGVTSNVATLSWNQSGTPLSWDIEIGAAGFTPTGIPTHIGVGNPYEMTNLSAASMYEYYVRTNCGEGDYSIWRGPRSFSTSLCDPIYQCDYSILLEDDYGDGWNGAVIGFRQNGILVATFGEDFDDGYSQGPFDVTLCQGLSTEIFAIESGSWSDEVGFTLWDPNGVITFQLLPGNEFDNGDIFYTFTPDCGIIGPEVPLNLAVNNETLQTGQTGCYAAEQVITVAGSGSYFIVQNGATARLIAGQKVTLLPGTHFQSGCVGHVFIDAGGQYCSNYSSMLADNDEDDSLIDFAAMNILNNSFIKVYPNPTTGIFNLMLAENNDFKNIVIEVYNMVGERIIHHELSGQLFHQFDLSENKPGLYLIKVIRGSEVRIEKIIKQ